MTISYVVPCVLALSQHLELANPTYLKTLVSGLKSSLERRFEGILRRVKSADLTVHMDHSRVSAAVLHDRIICGLQTVLNVILSWC